VAGVPIHLCHQHRVGVSHVPADASAAQGGGLLLHRLQLLRRRRGGHPLRHAVLCHQRCVRVCLSVCVPSSSSQRLGPIQSIGGNHRRCRFTPSLNFRHQIFPPLAKTVIIPTGNSRSPPPRSCRSTVTEGDGQCVVARRAPLSERSTPLSRTTGPIGRYTATKGTL